MPEVLSHYLVLLQRERFESSAVSHTVEIGEIGQEGGGQSRPLSLQILRPATTLH